MDIKSSIQRRLDLIFKGQFDPILFDRIVNSVEKTKKTIKSTNVRWDESDIVLITYGDSVQIPGETPLNTLRRFLELYLKDELSYVHILPFFPYSSDDGFSVIDYRIVDPELGNWNDVESLTANFKLMFDLVINHISQKSDWYQNYLKGNGPGKNFFIEADPNEDYSHVVRPRSLPLLTPAETVDGLKHVWTTFSADQIDLNFSNPALLTEMIEVFLFYLERGASMIRLDAIAFLWKEKGTNCLHLPQTHEFVKLLRDITDYLSQSLILLTETNVPNKENLSYFGNDDEAHMVYQFSLPPLLLNTLFTENSTYLTKWASSIPELPESNTFFNFTASHDGVGVRPLEGLLPQEEFNRLVEGMKRNGARISTKRNSDGSDSPYEINIAYFDAMRGIHSGMDKLQNDRFICSQTIMMTMKGVPAFYIHSLLATHNYTEGVEKTGMNRTINRRKWNYDELIKLIESETEHNFVLNRLKKLIQIRKANKSFHPNCSQQIMDVGKSIFCLSRNNGELLSISNITSKRIELNIGKTDQLVKNRYTDLISGFDYSFNISHLDPYQTVWLV